MLKPLPMQVVDISVQQTLTLTAELIPNPGESWSLFQGVRGTEDLAERTLSRCKGETAAKVGLGLQNDAPNWSFSMTKGPLVRLCLDCKSLL